jgi:endonuclease G
LSVTLLGCGSPPPSTTAHAAASPASAEPSAHLENLRDSPHVLFGLPVDADPSDDYLMDKTAYVLSYNRARGSANWVAWRLRADDLGTTDRANDFRADDQVPSHFHRITPSDYARSGYDRGHLCPSADRTKDEATNSETFLMSNMLPQVHALNAGPWKGIETYERELVANEGKSVYVVAGGIFARAPKTIGQGVAVPIATYRVTVVVQPGSGPNDVSDVTPILAVEMPNDASAKGHKWGEFRVSVDRVERDTGYDFLSALPDDVEARVEARAP